MSDDQSISSSRKSKSSKKKKELEGDKTLKDYIQEAKDNAKKLKVLKDMLKDS